MPEDQPPIEIRRLAEARREARAERNWGEADRLKEEIEAASWRVIDQGRAFTLQPAHPPDVTEEGSVRYGASAGVPSVLGEAATVAVTLIRAVPDHAPRVGALYGGAGDVQTVLVANRPMAALPAGDPEVVLLNGWLGAAAAVNAGLRRALGAIVVLADTGLDLSTDQVTALARALDDERVAVAGPWGLDSEDLRRWGPSGQGATDATAIDGRLLAFRRADAEARGPLDEGFVDPHRLDAWWSLVLRDEGLDASPRVARIVDLGLPRPSGWAAAPERDADADQPTAGGTPAQRRNFYRLVRHFGGARHLARD